MWRQTVLHKSGSFIVISLQSHVCSKSARCSNWQSSHFSSLVYGSNKYLHTIFTVLTFFPLWSSPEPPSSPLPSLLSSPSSLAMESIYQKVGCIEALYNNNPFFMTLAEQIGSEDEHVTDSGFAFFYFL
jgi:hypothetical protein